MDRWIEQGRVSVNGKTAPLGTQVEPSVDRVAVDGKPLGGTAARAEEKRYYAFYKPRRVVTTMSDPEGRPCIAEYIDRIPVRLFPVGRLDFDAEGLLILTNDGEFANKMIHPSNNHLRTYRCKVEGIPTKRAFEDLLEGLELDDGFARFEAMRPLERTDYNAWIEVDIAIGRNHIVKRLWSAVGHPVQKLLRTKLGGILLGDMEPGDIRPLTLKEISSCL